MISMYNLTHTQIQLALNLAVGLDYGLISPVEVARIFKMNLPLTKCITEFWFHYNDTTRRALDKVIVETARQSFETCYKKDAQGYNELEK